MAISVPSGAFKEPAALGPAAAAATVDGSGEREVRSLGTISSSDEASSSTMGRARGPERMRGASPSRRGSGEPGRLAIDSHNFYSFRNLTR